MAKKKSNKSNPAQNRDRFGCRKGTECAAIDSKFTGRSPVTVDRIVKATKLSRERVRGHLRFLKKKKLVKETKDGAFVALV